MGRRYMARWQAEWNPVCKGVYKEFVQFKLYRTWRPLVAYYIYRSSLLRSAVSTPICSRLVRYLSVQPNGDIGRWRWTPDVHLVAQEALGWSGNAQHMMIVIWLNLSKSEGHTDRHGVMREWASEVGSGYWQSIPTSYIQDIHCSCISLSVWQLEDGDDLDSLTSLTRLNILLICTYNI